MIKYSEPIMRKRFVAETMSKAKTNALKWVGEYLMCKGDAHDLMYHFEVDKSVENCIVVTLFAAIDVKEIWDRHCTICSEFHKSFFINENFNCNECKAKAFQERLSEMLKSKKSFYRSIIKTLLGG